MTHFLSRSLRGLSGYFELARGREVKLGQTLKSTSYRQWLLSSCNSGSRSIFSGRPNLRTLKQQKRDCRKDNIPVLTLFTKEECSLCDDAKVVIEKHSQKLVLQVVDITYPGNEHWYEKYKHDIPVIHIDGQYSMKHKIFEEQLIESLLNAQLRRASSRAKVSTERQILKEEATNFFSRNPLIKSLTFKDNTELRTLCSSPNARFIVFGGLNPLTYSRPSSRKLSLFIMTWKDLAHSIGCGSESTEDFVYLGNKINEDSDSGEELMYFSVNLERARSAEVEKILHSKLSSVSFSHPTLSLFKLREDEASIVCQARSILAWHLSHRHCAFCGSITAMKHLGYKRACDNVDCKTNQEVSNISYPRIDPVVMSSVVSPDRTSLLLGRKASFPPGMYSCLAGFLEPGESIESAVKRETFEESGIDVKNTKYHSSQPWPFPASLMIGCISEATSVALTMDSDELEDLQWFSKTQLAKMLEPRAAKEGKLYVPPHQTIANALLKSSLHSLQ